MYMFVRTNLLHFVDDIAFVDCWKFVQSKKNQKTNPPPYSMHIIYCGWTFCPIVSAES